MDSNARTCASAIILQQDVITRRMLRSGPCDGTLVSSEPTIDQPYVCCCSTLILDLQATSQASNKTQRAGVRVFRISLACASAPYERAGGSIARRSEAWYLSPSPYLAPLTGPVTVSANSPVIIPCSRSSSVACRSDRPGHKLATAYLA